MPIVAAGWLQELGAHWCDMLHFLVLLGLLRDDAVEAEVGLCDGALYGDYCRARGVVTTCDMVVGVVGGTFIECSFFCQRAHACVGWRAVVPRMVSSCECCRPPYWL